MSQKTTTKVSSMHPLSSPSSSALFRFRRIAEGYPDFTVQGHPEFTKSIVDTIVDAREAAGVFDKATAEGARERSTWRNDRVGVIAKVIWNPRRCTGGLLYLGQSISCIESISAHL